ncbi:MAG: hypothetical protein K2X07_08505 [Caulobacteraceae bacterium]|nr:hypothetical protein [Caulobacteraceae bacterium]
MKKHIAVPAFLILAAAALPAATQTQTQICDEERFQSCKDDCARAAFNSDQKAGCVLGCAIATNCE